MYIFDGFWFYEIPACANVCVCVSVFLVFLFLLFLYFVLFCFSVLFYFILFYSLEVCLFSSKRQKEYRFQRKGGEEDLRGVEEGKSVIRIFYMEKKFYFQ